jgi:hypothetical protein
MRLVTGVLSRQTQNVTCQHFYSSSAAAVKRCKPATLISTNPSCFHRVVGKSIRFVSFVSLIHHRGRGTPGTNTY